ncbi:PLC-like phosphodiesterase [Ampelomyces quisqualis]|uniref:Altered inheritance of mitochondria protein 6 n=1 Tax=Ampelomyces quisqualis TaxID=50730 RepID=A0A6A5R0J6_AMPQU|nr:PLC-like phosphodiesterase [Ampelomyces quisqualis]
MSVRRRRNAEARSDGFKSVKLTGEEKSRTKKFRWRKRTCLGLPVLVLLVFGCIHIVNFLIGYVTLFWDDPAASSLDWTLPGQASSDIASHLLDITRDVTPIPCHSHNDYWRRVPLYDALRWGCTGVEADVWLFDEELYVGHSTNALTPNKTFRSMYVDPLVKMLDHKNKPADFATTSSIKNGVFDTTPEQTLVLLVDFKNDGRAIFPFVSQHLTALREKGYLTYFDGNSTIKGAITVVATGNAPFDMIIANSTYREIFFDAPLASMYEPAPSSPSTNNISARGGQGTVGTTPASHFDSTNSYYASVNFRKAIGFVWWGALSATQLDLLRGQIRGAHARGLKARYWSAPTWPIALRNRMWTVLVDEGVDYLNGDDLRGMTRLDWGVRRHWSLIG